MKKVASFSLRDVIIIYKLSSSRRYLIINNLKNHHIVLELLIKLLSVKKTPQDGDKIVFWGIWPKILQSVRKVINQLFEWHTFLGKLSFACSFIALIWAEFRKCDLVGEAKQNTQKKFHFHELEYLSICCNKDRKPDRIVNRYTTFDKRLLVTAQKAH